MGDRTAVWAQLASMIQIQVLVLPHNLYVLKTGADESIAVYGPRVALAPRMKAVRRTRRQSQEIHAYRATRAEFAEGFPERLPLKSEDSLFRLRTGPDRLPRLLLACQCTAGCAVYADRAGGTLEEEAPIAHKLTMYTQQPPAEKSFALGRRINTPTGVSRLGVSLPRP